jgi:AraC family transcriptional activator of pobA
VQEIRNGKVAHLLHPANHGPSANGPVVRFQYFCGMTNGKGIPRVIGSIAEFCRLMALPPPEHPLVSVIRPEAIRQVPAGLSSTVVLDFFSVWLTCDCNMRFFLPGSLLCSEMEGGLRDRGWWLLIQPEFLMKCSVAKNIEQYGLFARAEDGVVVLGAKEERIMAGILQDIERGYLAPRAACSQEAILEGVETLLQFAERFYRRQGSN